MKYFHLIPDEEWEEMKNQGKTWVDIAKEYKQPDWCQYQDALDPLGCWSLVGRMVKNEAYCEGCDLHKRREE